MINDELFLENGEKSKSGFFRRLIKDYQFRTFFFAVFSAVFTAIYGAVSGVFAAMGNSELDFLTALQNASLSSPFDESVYVKLNSIAALLGI
ncbi:unknown [Acidaminococcus sp. CAG:917]|nr:unknown [Acidaminococcus sp. CAG:917]